MTRDIYYAKYYGKEGAGGGKCLLGRKLRIREKNEKGERKTTEEDYIKNGGKGLKNIFLGYKHQKFSLMITYAIHFTRSTV